MTSVSPTSPGVVGEDDWQAMLDHWLTEHRDQIIAIRRHLHSHPELGREEHSTTELIAQRLTLAGLEPRRLSCGTGLACDVAVGDANVRDHSDDPAFVALRADLDALPMDDEKDVDYRSQNPGVAHACGHDVHTTVVLGAGLFLARHSHLLPNPVRLLFQPAEELVPGGALDMLAEGELDGVSAVLGLHCEPKLDSGQVGLRTGAITSAADFLEIELHGPGGHTARPAETVDLITVAAEVALNLPEMVRFELESIGPVQVVFGTVQAGDAGNVIPTHARLRGSVRTPSLDVWDHVRVVVERSVEQLIDGTGAATDVRYHRGIPPVLNDGGVIDRVAEAAAKVLGADALTEAPQSWGGDDFAWLAQKTPAAYVRIGTHDPADGLRLDLHAGHFDVDEAAIAVGIRVLVATAILGAAPVD